MRRFLIAALLMLTSCGANTPTGTLTVFAAASLREAFTEIARAFEAATPGRTVTLNFAGSQQLAEQIAAGAPADVFASANDRQMTRVRDSGRIKADAPQTFARNRLVVIFPAANPGRVTTLTDLTRPGLKLVFADARVPVGEYSLTFLAKASADLTYGPAYSEAVRANVVSYEEDVRAVFAKVALGEADAGIVYSSDAQTDRAAQVGTLEIPDALNTIAGYPIAVLEDSPNRAAADAFVAFVLSPAGQAILAKYGFVSPVP
jgi:molybdate transport system substrate-binding protein